MTTTATPQVRLTLLGAFELEVDGEAVDLKPAAQRLVALLALTGGAVERTFAAGQMWPDADRERGLANLRSAIWRLRDIPAPLLTASKTHVRLAPTVWVDVRHGLQEIAGGHADAASRTAGRHGGPGAARWETTLFADLLPDWYDDWLDTERERIRQLRLAGLERDGELLLAWGQAADGIQCGLRATSMEPLRESAHRLVIRCHLAEGNLVEAIRQYRRYAALLRRELGAEPSADLTGLLAACTCDGSRDLLEVGHGLRHRRDEGAEGPQVRGVRAVPQHRGEVEVRVGRPRSD